MSTTQLALSETPRSQWWRSQLGPFVGTCHTIETPPGVDFDIGVNAGWVGDIFMLDIHGCAHRSHGYTVQGNERLLVRYMVEGEARLSNGHKTIDLREGELALFPYGSKSDLLFKTPYHQINLVLSADTLRKYFPGWESLAMAPWPADKGPAALLAQHMVSLSKQITTLSAHDTCMAEATMAMVCAALFAQIEATPKDSSRMHTYHLARAQHYVRTHLRNPELDVPMIAGAIGVSQRYLHQIFSDTGLSIMKWVWQERLRHCHDALENHPERTVATISHDWGFSDPAHFSRAFRKAYGIPPAAVRAAKPQAA